jgi:DNA-binding transcriptional regulator GbsR (MarR family)
MGLTRMAGRVLGVLLISDPAAQSLTQISEALEASKSAISTATRLLVEANLIEQVPSPLPRRDYFRFKPGGWLLFMGQQMRLFSTLHQITERGLELMQAKSPELQTRLQEAHDLFSSLEAEYPTWLETVSKQRKGQR